MHQSRALKLLLKRGALVAAANWPVVVVQFVADAFFKALLAVPIVGGMALVVLLVGADPSELIRMRYQDAVPAVIGALLTQPAALAAFLGALAVVAAGGSVLMFAVKAGTITVLVAGERAAGLIEQPPLHLAAVARDNQFSIERYVAGVRRYFRRFLVIGAVLALAYAGATAAFGAVIVGIERGPLVTAVASVWLVAFITLVNFLYLLAQIIVCSDDCSVADAASRVARLLVAGTRPVLGILGAILVLMLLSTAASVLATAALGLIAFVPFVGLAALPLQIFAWLLRGLVFQYIGLAGASSYLRLHRLTSPAEEAAGLVAAWEGAGAAGSPPPRA